MSEIVDRRNADENNDVVTVAGGSGTYRRFPCGGCPWRVDQTGEFPAEAFRLSANTAYDMSTHTFACHEAGVDRPTICAGFLLRGSAHNLSVRLKLMNGQIDWRELHDAGVELHEDYRAMAEANGVDPDDPALRGCR